MELSRSDAGVETRGMEVRSAGGQACRRVRIKMEL